MESLRIIHYSMQYHFTDGIEKFAICICVSDELFVIGKPRHRVDHPRRVCA